MRCPDGVPNCQGRRCSSLCRTRSLVWGVNKSRTKAHNVVDGNDWSALADDFRTFLLSGAYEFETPQIEIGPGDGIWHLEESGAKVLSTSIRT